MRLAYASELHMLSGIAGPSDEIRHQPATSDAAVATAFGASPPRDRPRPAALVLALGVVGLGVVRSLAHLGVEVHGVYSGGVPPPPGHYSRALRTRYSAHGLTSDDRKIAMLRAIRRRVSPDERMVLLATSDGWASFVAVHQLELAADFIVRAPPTGIETTFLDKRTAVAVCEQKGMPIPKSCVPLSERDVEHAADHFRFPVIIKPASQEDPDFPGKNVVVADAHRLRAFYQDHPDLVVRSMFQEFIPSGDGRIVGVNTYSGPDGRVMAWTSHRRLRQWLPDRGASCYAVTETLPQLRDLTIRFLNEIGYVGFAGVEYAEDVRSGDHVFLELNARPVLPNRLFADAGVDLTAIAYLEMCGESAPQDLVQRDGIYWMDLYRDLPSSFVKWRRGELGIREWVRSVRRVTSHPVFDPHDLNPFLATIGILAMAATGRTLGRQRRSIGSISELIRTEVDG